MASRAKNAYTNGQRNLFVARIYCAQYMMFRVEIPMRGHRQQCKRRGVARQ